MTDQQPPVLPWMEAFYRDVGLGMISDQPIELSKRREIILQGLAKHYAEAQKLVEEPMTDRADEIAAGIVSDIMDHLHTRREGGQTVMIPPTEYALSKIRPLVERLRRAETALTTHHRGLGGVACNDCGRLLAPKEEKSNAD